MKKSKFNNLIDLIKAQSKANRGLATELSKLKEGLQGTFFRNNKRIEKLETELSEQITLNLNNILKHKKEIAYIRKKMGD